MNNQFIEAGWTLSLLHLQWAAMYLVLIGAPNCLTPGAKRDERSGLQSARGATEGSKKEESTGLMAG